MNILGCKNFLAVDMSIACLSIISADTVDEGFQILGTVCALSLISNWRASLQQTRTWHFAICSVVLVILVMGQYPGGRGSSVLTLRASEKILQKLPKIEHCMRLEPDIWFCVYYHLRLNKGQRGKINVLIGPTDLFETGRFSNLICVG